MPRRASIGSHASGLAVLVAWLCLVGGAEVVAQDAASLVGLPVTAIEIVEEGRPVSDPLIHGLIETVPGAPLAMADVRETIDHLDVLGRFDDVQVLAVRAGDGVRLTWVLTPAHPVRELLFRGTLRLPESDLRQAVAERYGALPPASRAADVAESLRQFYSDHGFLGAAVTTRVDLRHDPDAASLVVTIDVGPQSTVERVRVEGIDGGQRSALLDRIGIRPGQPYDLLNLQEAVAAYEAELRGLSYYEARIDPSTEFTPEGAAVVTIFVDRGPRVSVTFAGDVLPQAVREQLVPVRQEASADEDLLENGALAIQDYLYARGHRDALADYVRREDGEHLEITYTVAEGARFVVDDVDVRGAQAAAKKELLEVIALEPGQPFVQADVARSARALGELYRARGFTQVSVESVTSISTSEREGGDRRVGVSFDIAEGPRAVVGTVTFAGLDAMTAADARALVGTEPGRPFVEGQMLADSDRLVSEYLDRGYERVTINPTIALADDGTRADVRFAVTEGPQVIVGHVIILGNRRTASATIERELLLKPGEPLGFAARIESQQRLSALGLFRAVRITVPRAGPGTLKDVLVEVEEAPPTSIGYGGGLEGGRRLRLAADGGRAEERFELAPRVFFEIGRRNLWGSNRSINLFTRASLRSRDTLFSSEGEPVARPAESRYGFNEYRAVATYREPRLFDTRSDLLVNGILEQSIRSSFNFRRREVAAQSTFLIAGSYRLTGTYTYRSTELFDEVFTADEKPLIDRVFPQVNLSMFSAAVIRDTRTDALDPDHGNLLGVESSFAVRAFGSEVGFGKTYLQAFTFHRLPTARRVVAALAARIGIARGYPRGVPRLDADGTPLTGPDGSPLVDLVEDLPASERFFAGGDTTVRGFSLDRLGDADTITKSGFPAGGNGLVVFNGELRVALFGGLSAVGFLDGGNVFRRARSIRLTRLRGAAGFGIRYRSPVGPIRVDWGFNLDPRELVPALVDAAGAVQPAVRERGNVLHISLGQAF